MNDEPNPRATMGDNNPPEGMEIRLEDLTELLAAFTLEQIAHHTPDFDGKVYADLRDKMVRISEDAAIWIKMGQINDAETASLAADHIAQLRAAKKLCETSRTAMKKIWNEKGQRAFDTMSRLVNTADKGIEKMLDIQGNWLKRENERLAKEAEEKAAEAERLRLENEKAKARAEESGDIMGMAEAEAQEKEVKKAAKEAAKAGKVRASAAGAAGGARNVMRTVKEVTVNSRMALILHLKDHPKMIELTDQLAAAEARAADFDPKRDKIPGCTVTTKEVPA